MPRRRCDLQRLWKERLKESKSASFTVREYCRRNSLTIHQYYYWRKKINDSRVYAVREKEEDLTEVIFAPEKKESTGLRVSFGNGIEIIPEKEFNEYEFIRLSGLIRSM
jgi:hypothetical protein